MHSNPALLQLSLPALLQVSLPADATECALASIKHVATEAHNDDVDGLQAATKMLQGKPGNALTILQNTIAKSHFRCTEYDHLLQQAVKQYQSYAAAAAAAEEEETGKKAGHERKHKKTKAREIDKLAPLLQQQTPVADSLPVMLLPTEPRNAALPVTPLAMPRPLLKPRRK